MSCIRPQILSDEQQSTEIVLIEKISHENFGVQTFWNHSSVSYTFCSTHNSRIKSEVSAFIFISYRIFQFSLLPEKIVKQSETLRQYVIFYALSIWIVGI